MVSNKSRILIFVDWYVPAFKAGGPIRSIYNLITKFKTDYEFYVITSDRDLGDNEPFQNIETNKWTDVEGVQVMYLSPANYKIKEFKKFITEVNPHIVYLNSLFSFNFSLVPLWLKKHFPDIKYILAPRGMHGKGALKIKKKRKKRFLLSWRDWSNYIKVLLGMRPTS